jgi:hypothetical protein
MSHSTTRAPSPAETTGAFSSRQERSTRTDCLSGYGVSVDALRCSTVIAIFRTSIPSVNVATLLFVRA